MESRQYSLSVLFEIVLSSCVLQDKLSPDIISSIRSKVCPHDNVILVHHCHEPFLISIAIQAQ